MGTAKTERMLLVDPAARNKLIGDELASAFWVWANEDSGETSNFQIDVLFTRWLVETGPGAEALGLLNKIPRQLWLDFQDRAEPWEVRDV